MPKTLCLVVVALVAAPAGLGVAQVGNWSTTDQSLGNLTVTGQVTGGFAFQGRVPYAGANELRLQLPSETIDRFQRDSMGLDRVRSGSIYGPQPYTPPSRATYMLRQTARTTYGFNAVTGSVDTSGTAALVAPQPDRPEVIRNYAFTPILSQEDIAKAVSRTDTTGITLTPTPTISAVTTVDQDRPGTSALFGMIQESQRQRLAETTLEAKMLQEDQGTATDETTDETPQGSERPQEWKLHNDEATTPEEGQTPQPPQPDNVFADMLARLSQTGPTAPQPQDLRPGAVPPSNSLEQLDTDPSTRVQARQAGGTLAGAVGQSVVVRNLAGAGGGLFNRYMAKGDRLLRDGRFYQAALAYSRARLVHEFDPVASLGAGLAYLGAGENYRASFQLRRSVQLFPDLVRVRVDIDALVGADVVDRRLAQIRHLIGDTVDASDMPQVFLMTFINANRGQLEKARHWAAELAPLVTDDSRLHDYAEAILGDQQTDTKPGDATQTP